MAKKKVSGIIQYILLILLAITIVLLLLYMIPKQRGMNDLVLLNEYKGDIQNPLIGFAPPAENAALCSKTNLVFIELSWAEWEPEKGVYDTKYLEDTFCITKWKEEGKNAVFRFVCDIPGTKEHMDIPQWLYDETGDGEFYDYEGKKGYSPNYENSYFLSRHALAIKALGDYFNKDYFLAYVELGSVGHWGEWHASSDDGTNMMPSDDICWKYVESYTESFTNVKLLTRRNYEFSAVDSLGLFNDMIGSREDTDEWLSWINDGGSQELSRGEIEYVPMSDFWKISPSGGEITSSISLDKLATDELPDLVRQLDESHASFVGPKTFPNNSKYKNAFYASTRHLGYRYYISKIDIKYIFSTQTTDITLSLTNTGNAPIYWDYPVTIDVYDVNKKMVFWQSPETDLTKLLPGETLDMTISIQYIDDLKDGMYIGFRITDYEGKNLITLANEPEDIEWWGKDQIVYSSVKTDE